MTDLTLDEMLDIAAEREAENLTTILSVLCD